MHFVDKVWVPMPISFVFFWVYFTYPRTRCSIFCKYWRGELSSNLILRQSALRLDWIGSLFLNFWFERIKCTGIAKSANELESYQCCTAFEGSYHFQKNINSSKTGRSFQCILMSAIKYIHKDKWPFVAGERCACVNVYFRMCVNVYFRMCECEYFCMCVCVYFRMCVCVCVL